MKRVVLVIGLLIVAGTVFAGGRPELSGVAKQAQTKAQTGECDNDCDGVPDQIRLKERLKDGSCQDDLGVASVCQDPEKPDQDRVRARDHDGVPDGDRTKDRIRLSNPKM